jgi:hypothetical protein
MNDTDETLREPTALSMEDMLYLQTQEICELRGRVAEAERQSSAARRLATQSQSLTFELSQKNTALERQFPNPRWVALAQINALVDELPRRPISKQGLHKWCVGRKVRAQLRSGRWLVDPG